MKSTIRISALVLTAVAACFISFSAFASGQDRESALPSPAAGQAVATFAGGCFWCMEEPFDVLDGVVSTTSGYTGGTTTNPTYRQVVSGTTGHTEAVQVIYDPAIVSFEELLHVFWRNIDPLDGGGQFCDRGSSYRTGIFFHDETQRRASEASVAELDDSGRFDRPIVTEITALDVFYPAEDYHQDYYQKNAARYAFYRRGCGRDRRLQALWGDEADIHGD